MLRCGDCGHTASFLRESGYSNVETVYWVACATCKKMTMWRPAIAALNPYKPVGDGLDEPPPQVQNQNPPWVIDRNTTMHEIGILFHYGCQGGEPHPESPAATITVSRFLEAGVLERMSEPPGFRITPLGLAWIKALCRVPIPKAVFIDDKGQVIE